jgi:hypothetical protein
MPPGQVEDFQDWYDSSDEVRVWERRMQDFTATIVSKGRAQQVIAPDNKAAGDP